MRRAFAANSIKISGPFTVSQNGRFTASIGNPAIGLPKHRSVPFEEPFVVASTTEFAVRKVNHSSLLIDYVSLQETHGTVYLNTIAGRLIDSWSIMLRKGNHSRQLDTPTHISKGMLVMHVKAKNIDKWVKLWKQ